ncbi:hypothetical protein [Moritella sp. F3]|uniref:hypothetical protein n=1 Tax=Moritella sp. F3 TaxID=2718882 RepID=UPI0018E150AD|nr:hypothetical protein [Moritella sp. F3]GIC76017.1 hypothetical protein FMO001_07440 [Moritella sp. F1]GIC81556.1 hypothetical protein FMO003_18370 [Moritella sp. F3]
MQLFSSITYDSNNHLRKFFSKHAQFKTTIEQDIEERLPTLLNTNSYKIKFAHKLTHQGNKIEEYKIVLTPQLSCRVAFVHHNNVIKIIYISDNITKKIYCSLLEKTDLVD